MTRQPRITHCPYCGDGNPTPIPGGDQAKESIARCNRCRAVFSVSVVAWDRDGGGGPSPAAQSSYEWKKRK